jgi:putative ABC transport system permease protein
MMHDLRAVWRAARRAPIFTATAVITLAIGIGASTAMFSIVNAVLLRPLPFRDAHRLVEVFEANPSEGREQSGVAAANFLDWRGRSKTLDDLALMMIDANPSVLGIGDTSIQARMALVTPNLMSVLGVPPALGRGFGSPQAEEIILSHGFWHRAFGGDPAVIGRRVRVEGAPGTVIVGVMPASFSLRDGIEFWMPLDPAASGMADRDARYLQAVGRLRASATLEGARAELAAIALRLARDYPATNAGWTVGIQQFTEPNVERHRLGLLTLFAATAFVMLVGCANVSNLLLARGVARQSELAVRSALGASRRRIAQLLFTESMALSLAGGVAGLMLACGMLPILVRLSSRVVPRVATANLSASVLIFSLAACLIAAIAAGLAPAFRLSRTDLQLTIKTGGERTTHGGDAQVQRWIVAGGLALCLTLVLGATLFIRTFVNLTKTNLGFTPSHVISIDARFPMYRTTERNRWQLLARDTSAVLQRLRSIAGVDAAAAVNNAPLSGTLVPVEVMLAGETRGRRAFYQNVTPGYFGTLDIPVIAGRDFNDADVSHLATSPVPDPRRREEGVVIVNETAARLFWPDGNALGQTLSTAYDPGIS